MSTVAEICTALSTTLSGISAIDQASITEYLPPVNTQSAALIITPFGQEDRFYFVSALVLAQAHTIICEIWCKHSGNTAATFTLARDVSTSAVRALMANSDLGGVVQSVGFASPSSGFEITSDIADNFVKVGGVSYLPVRLKVPVLDYADRS